MVDPATWSRELRGAKDAADPQLVKVPSPADRAARWTSRLLKGVHQDRRSEPRLRHPWVFADIRYDAMGNLIAAYGAGTSGKSLMLIGKRP